ncbi:NADH-quinone oxidoreductase, chain G [Sterolibacterium denitrificans]|uniref:NADH-quinone oxidoreductase n=1 Tax=Sterolibacterium denitrificans TaxID=157592 RepID=A0A7Z7HR70_9PROT|nr:NADH-quinone oxidoreductase subunit NuoG [Sterolibacterium denitrificans]SMB24703.1 NADH-quinone oxidoreductase, chain G [Sterolibacterium denitrificans]
MLDIEIDGEALQVAEGSTVIEAAHQLGVYIPHFCYHKKLSIAASCRMCLVEVEKAPKPLPACATPVTNGMKVFTHSPLAVKAQKGVMEFLLINHPLDCPVCDQGGECQLQDLSVGYGYDNSRFIEAKRVVVNKDLGSLIRTDMTRCIHCTRCVRFLEEIGGQIELGQANRGDRSEIMPFIEGSIKSELSGNIIDLCPVGALTSKPFRFSARTWELARRKSVSPHDGLGSNLAVQTKHDKVMRVLPLENEDINECWLSDKDRFSYEALNSAERLTKPMLKHGGEWHEVDWARALDYVAHALNDIARNQPAGSIATLASPHATLEELYLAQKLTRGLAGVIDSRLRTSDFGLDGQRQGIPWLGMKISEISQLDRVLVIGSFLRKDHPLIAQRLRRRARQGAQVSLLHVTADDPLIRLHASAFAAPRELPALLAQVVKSAAEQKGVSVAAELAAVQVGEDARRIAASLLSAANGAVFLGNYAEQHAQAAVLQALAQQLAEITGVRLGYLGAAANSVGAYVAGAVAQGADDNAARLLATPRKAYLLLQTEPELDCVNPRAAVAALKQAATVVALTAFKSASLMEHADVLLPVAPFTETSGSFVNGEGRLQSFNAVVKAQGEARPAWKVLRVLGNLTGQDGFDYASSEDVRNELLPEAPAFVAGLNNQARAVCSAADLQSSGKGLQRIAEVPSYFADALVRRAPSLQKTPDAAPPAARMSAATLQQLNLTAGQNVRVRQDGGEVQLPAQIDDSLPDGCLRVAAAHASTAALGAATAEITVERA